MTPTNPEAVERLIERLRTMAESFEGGVTFEFEPKVRAVMTKAADALTAANARVAELETALKPFAAKADEIDRVADAQGWSRESIIRRCNYQDCVAARRTLANDSAA